MADSTFPGGNTIAVVTSWDGGTPTDRIMKRMLDQYGWKGTFYVCPALIGTEGHLDREALCEIVAAGHEIGAHSLNHPHLETLSPAECKRQLTESRAQLETLFGRPVISFAYPDGLTHVQTQVAEAVRAAGYTSARTVEVADLMTARTLATGDWMRLPVTGYFTDELNALREKWDAIEASGGGVFHLWGHSKNLGEDPRDWVDFECILGFFGGITGVWYCTVGELVAHIQQGY